MNSDNIIVNGVLVCVNYAAILDLTLEQNTKILDNIYVVTKQTDIETIDVCKKYRNVKLLFFDFKVTEDWLRVKLKRFNSGEFAVKPDMRTEFWPQQINNCNKKAFNKGGGLRIGQQQLAKDYPAELQLVMDCDIVLPENFRDEITKTQADILYTPNERRDFESLAAYQTGSPYKKYTGTRAGWGFFQLYKPSDITSQVFYDDWHTAATCDAWFRNDVIKKDYDKLKHLDLIVSHLGARGDSKFEQEYKFKL